MIEKEVPDPENDEVLPFTEQEPLVMSDEPLVMLYPKSADSSDYIVEAAVTGGGTIRFGLDNFSVQGDIDEAAVNQAINQQLLRAVMHNSGLSGALESFYGRGDSSFGVARSLDLKSMSEDGQTRQIFSMFLGSGFDPQSGFIGSGEINALRDSMRWLTVDGDLGMNNRIDPQATQAVMTAVFGASPAEVAGNLQRAGQFMNTGGTEQPSLQVLYRSMYPDEAASGYPKLRNLVGEKQFALLNMPTSD